MSQHHASSPSKCSCDEAKASRSKYVNHPEDLSLDKVMVVTPMTTIPPLEKKFKKPISSHANKSKDKFDIYKGNAPDTTDDRSEEDIVNVDRSIRRLVDRVLNEGFVVPGISTPLA